MEGLCKIEFSKIKNGVWAELSRCTVLKINQSKLKCAIFSIYVIKQLHFQVIKQREIFQLCSLRVLGGKNIEAYLSTN